MSNGIHKYYPQKMKVVEDKKKEKEQIRDGVVEGEALKCLPASCLSFYIIFL